MLWILEKILLPFIGVGPIAEITPQELLAVLGRPEGEGKIETANRAKIIAGQVFRYAVVELKPGIKLNKQVSFTCVLTVHQKPMRFC